jgi:hypothetical protein
MHDPFCEESAMKWLNPWKRLFTRKTRPGTRQPTRARLQLESLEGRLVPSSVPMHVAGSQLLDPAGNAVVLRGVNIASLESQPGGDVNDQGEPTILRSVDVALHDWHANLIRVTIYPDFWFGHDEGVGGGDVDPEAPGGTRQLVDQIVAKANANNAYVMLAVWGSDQGNLWAAPKMHDLPDNGTTAFWMDVAARYRNNAAVMFDPMNEPHDVSWDQWRNGSTNGRPQIDENGVQYDSPGMQGLLDAIRGTGANNIVAPEGLGYGSDLSGITGINNYALDDPAGNLMYQIHLYPAADQGGDGVPSVAVRDARVQAVAAKYPIYVGEWGTYSDDSQNPDKENTGAGWTTGAQGQIVLNAAQYSQDFLAWLDQHPSYNWTAWDLNPNSGPNLISDWNYTPTDYFGAYVKDSLAAHANDPAPIGAPAPAPLPGPAPVPALPLAASAAFTDVNDWGSGFTGSMILTNTGGAAINGWTLEFDFTGEMTDIWNAQIVNHVGNHYVIQNADWDATIAAGRSIDFGFNADWGALKTGPSGYVLNGVAIPGL